MDELKNKINNELKLLEKMILDNVNKEEICKKKKYLDDLLNEFIDSFN